jgi:hypothetical protein
METVTVKQIHNEFDAAAERLINEAEETGREIAAVQFPEGKRAERLKSLGFTGMPEVVELEQMKAEAQRKVEELEKNREFNEKTLYYKRKYPFLKFITEEQLDRICKKYNLAYAPAGNYTGSIPDRNLAEIESARIDKEDLVVTTWTVTMENGKRIRTRVISEERYKKENVPFCPFYRLAQEAGFQYPHSIKKTCIKNDEKEGLFIAAGKSMLNLEGLEKSKSGFGFFEKHKPEAINPGPVVFCHVKGGVLIITQWGGEAKGPEPVVAELN